MVQSNRFFTVSAILIYEDSFRVKVVRELERLRIVGRGSQRMLRKLRKLRELRELREFGNLRILGF